MESLASMKMENNVCREGVVQIFAVHIADYSLELYLVITVAGKSSIKLDRLLMDI